MVQTAGSFEEAALGSVLGACVGDAAGATLEFLGRKPTDREIDQALALVGGGPFGVAPGQVTDDGELTISLANALAESLEFDLELIARSYADWVRSRPFDIGMATRGALGCFLDQEWASRCETQGYAAGMMAAAAARNSASKANGSLMRASPIGVWAHDEPDDRIAEYARLDSRLSHPNPSCADAVACYAIAIAHLVRAPGDRAGAFERAEAWAKCDAHEEVAGWLRDAREDVRVPFHPLVGFVRIGFTHAFRHLLLGSGFVEAVRETLAGGGDTDTNACIVGGLVGAAAGVYAIPRSMRDRVLGCDTSNGRPRPPFLYAENLPRLIDRILMRRKYMN